MNDETEKAIKDTFFAGYKAGFEQASAKYKRIYAQYVKELKEAKERWENSDD